MSADKQFDIRILERNFRKGNITREEYEKHLESLEDVEKNAAEIEAEFEVGVLEDEEEEAEEEDE